MVISEATYDLVKKNQWIFDTLEIHEHCDVAIGVIGKAVKSYRVEQIFAASYSGSEDDEGLAVGEENEEQEDDGFDKWNSGEESGGSASEEEIEGDSQSNKAAAKLTKF